MSTTEIVYKDIAPGADEDALVTTASAAAFSHPELLPFGGPIGRTMSLELDQWGLDGTFFPAEDQERVGFWSVQLSGADGSFREGPTIEVSFDEQYSAMGLTIDFDAATGDHPTRVGVKWYQQGTLKAAGEFTPDRTSYFCNQKVTGFDRIEITVLETRLPYRYVRIGKLIFGVIRRFGMGELRKASIVNELDRLAASLPVSKLTWTLDSREDTDYLFQMKQPVEVVNDGRLLGVYYIDGSSRAARSIYDISCCDALGVLGEIPFPDSVYHDWSARELTEEIVGGYFELDIQAPDITVSGILRKESRRSALQQLLFAWGACAATDGQAGIRIFQPKDSKANTLGMERVFHGGKASTAAIVTEVRVTAHTYTADEKGTIDVGGVKYRDGRTVFALKNPDVTVNDKANIHMVENATLVSSANVQAVAHRVYDDCVRRTTVEASVLWDGERLGDALSVPMPWGGTGVGTLTKMTIKLSNTVVAGSVLRGEEMAFLDRLVCDQGQEDVDEWLALRRKGWAAMTEKERTRWMEGMRGAYNAGDLNRVIEALEYLVRLSRGVGNEVEIALPDIIDVSSGTPVVRHRWQVGDIPSRAPTAAVFGKHKRLLGSQ